MNETKTYLSRLTAFLLCAVLLFGAMVTGAFADEETQALSEKEAAEALLKNDHPAYATLCSAIEEGRRSVDISSYNLNKDEAGRMMERVVYDHPEYFYLNVSYNYSLDWQDNVTTLYFTYHYEGDARQAAIEEYESLMGDLYDLGSEEWSDLETVLFYHDYLAAHYAYDAELAIFDAYTFVKTGEGVCQSYALVFDALMSHFDIPCTFAQSRNLNHIWNLIFLDGEWYYVDVTWDDPMVYNRGENVDRPGSAMHDYFLLSADEDLEAHFTSRGKQSDLFTGADVTAASKAHPYSHVWKDATAPFVEAGGHFYGIVVSVDQEGKMESARFAEVNFDKGAQITGYEDLPIHWFVAGDNSRAYPGNYSGLCTDGRYVYYSTDSAVYKYDSQSGTRGTVDCSAVDGNQTRIYSLRYEKGKLVAYTCPNPNGPFVGTVLENALPAYYSVTWVVDADVFTFYVEEGVTPTFPGSTFKEGENGVSYQFLGWDRPVVPAYADATYTAMYAVVKEYMPGDVSGEGEISISDVSALLNYIANPETAQVNLAAIDPNGDGFTTISDVTLLLNFIAGQNVELH